MMIDIKRVSNKSTVLAMRELLIEVCRRPEKFKDENLLITALNSQGALYARFSDDRFKIKPLSINTVKRLSAEVITGGFKALDSLRVAAKDSLENLDTQNKQPNKKTKTGLAKLVKEQEVVIEDLRKLNFSLLQVINEVSNDLKTVANTKNEIVRLEKSEQAIQKIMVMFANKPG